MIYIILAVIVIAVLISPYIRCILFNLEKTLINGVVDIYYYFKHKKYNICPTGYLVGYVGLFGRGKTLTMTLDVVAKYRRYNGKMVWDMATKRYVKQVIHIVSNVELKTVPFERLIDLKQIVRISKMIKEQDELNATSTVTIVLIDEASVQLNSRKFKQNIDALLLNTLLTCRHYRLSMYYSAQRFGQVDALLRQVTSHVVHCDKVWRLQGYSCYDAWELENATNVLMLKPIRRGCYFITNKDYNAYDTLATVENLEKDCETGQMLSSEKILALQCNSEKANTDGIINPSRKLKKASKRIRK